MGEKGPVLFAMHGSWVLTKRSVYLVGISSINDRMSKYLIFAPAWAAARATTCFWSSVLSRNPLKVH